jgi:hypothetical protein
MGSNLLSPAGKVVATVVTLLTGAYLLVGHPWLTDAINTGQAGALQDKYYPKVTVLLVLLPAVFVGFLAGFLVDFVGWGKRSPAPSRVRLTAVPPGDEPEAVRAAWVGMVLPLAPGETGSRPRPPAGPASPGGDQGSPPGTPARMEWVYVIDAPAALALLAARDPEAAAWWREHAPDCLKPGHHFVFAADVCELELPDECQAAGGT